MSFDRFRVQLSIEKELGCVTHDNWGSYKQRLEQYHVPYVLESRFKDELTQDCKDLFYKGATSLSEALSDISRGYCSWPVVKLYYSVFYFLRASLASKGYAIIKNKHNYLLRIETGEQPQKRGGSKYKSEHSGIINIFKDIVGDTDILQTNKIEDKSVYEWLMDKRNQVNYRQREFMEPLYNDFLCESQSAVLDGRFSKQLDLYIKDATPIYCFDRDHACVAAPIKRAFLTKMDLLHAGISGFSKKKVAVFQGILSDSMLDKSLIYDLMR